MVALASSILESIPYSQPSRLGRFDRCARTEYVPPNPIGAKSKRFFKTALRAHETIYEIRIELVVVSLEVASSCVDLQIQSQWIEYNGESFDSRTGQLYLRARWYDMHRFTTLDRFRGNPRDPQSFNKYAFTSGDPILHNDPTGMFEGLTGLVSAMSNYGRLQKMDLVASMNAKRTAVAGITLAANAIVTTMVGINVAAAGFVPSGWVASIGLSGQVYGFGGAVSLGLYGDYKTHKLYAYLSFESGLAPLSTMRNHSSILPEISINFGFAFNVNSPDDIAGLDFNAVIPSAFVEWSKYLAPTNKNKMGHLLTLMARLNSGRISNRDGVFTLGQSSNFSTAVVMYGTKGYDWAATMEYSTPLLEIADLGSLYSYMAGNGFSDDDFSILKTVIEQMRGPDIELGN